MDPQRLLEALPMRGKNVQNWCNRCRVTNVDLHSFCGAQHLLNPRLKLEGHIAEKGVEIVQPI